MNVGLALKAAYVAKIAVKKTAKKDKEGFNNRGYRCPLCGRETHFSTYCPGCGNNVGPDWDRD